MAHVVETNNIRIERLELGPWATNAYVITCPKTGDSALIDAPADAKTIIERLQGTNPKYILLTHGHVDHIDALSELRAKTNARLAAHAADCVRLPFLPAMLLNDRDVILVGEVKIEVLHTPGHTPGSLCFKISDYLMSGDTIFPGGPGRTNSPADFDQIINSITAKIFVLANDTQVYPGHGAATTLKKEKNEFAIFSSRSHDPNLCGDVLWLSS